MSFPIDRTEFLAALERLGTSPELFPLTLRVAITQLARHAGGQQRLNFAQRYWAMATVFCGIIAPTLSAEIKADIRSAIANPSHGNAIGMSARNLVVGYSDMRRWAVRYGFIASTAALVITSDVVTEFLKQSLTLPAELWKVVSLFVCSWEDLPHQRGTPQCLILGRAVGPHGRDPRRPQKSELWRRINSPSTSLVTARGSHVGVPCDERVFGHTEAGVAPRTCPRTRQRLSDLAAEHGHHRGQEHLGCVRVGYETVAHTDRSRVAGRRAVRLFLTDASWACSAALALRTAYRYRRA